MTDRLTGVTVTFDRDIRDDDAEVILNAIRMIKNVKHVEPVIRSSDSWMAETRAKQEFREKLFDFIKDNL